jgi:hypothetical protein
MAKSKYFDGKNRDEKRAFKFKEDREQRRTSDDGWKRLKGVFVYEEEGYQDGDYVESTHITSFSK